MGILPSLGFLSDQSNEAHGLREFKQNTSTDNTNLLFPCLVFLMRNKIYELVSLHFVPMFADRHIQGQL